MDCCKNEIFLDKQENIQLKRVFIIVLIINAVMFGVELFSGILANSTALIADSLDMLGDTFVYGISLYVLSKDQLARNRASLLKGFVMLLLGLNVIRDVIVKLLNPSVPLGETITIIGILALLANLFCFYLLQKHKNGDINVKSAWICSRNDIVANISVIGAGFFVKSLNSMWPDIIVGLGISILVLQSSWQVIISSLKAKV